jgi:phosphatidylserine/phosphatidylglycerophosphate/cardiolipin synthase-like enzyme
LEDLSNRLILLSNTLPKNSLRKISDGLIQSDKPISETQFDILSSIPQISVRQNVAEFFNLWLEKYPGLSPREIGFTLQTLIVSNEMTKDRQGDINLIWTGPKTEHFTLRRIDQTLLDIIRSCTDEVFLVSFAVYKIPPLITEIEEAINRGVKFRFLLETPETSQGTISHDPRSSFSSLISKNSNFFIWPHENRPISSKGNRGVLHAKIAIGDEKHLLISSANLTQHAMEINMEMGVYIENGNLPKKVKMHFNDLIRNGVIYEFS